MEHLGFPATLPGVVKARQSRQFVNHQKWSVILHYGPSKLPPLFYFCSFINKVGQKKRNGIAPFKMSSCSEQMRQMIMLKYSDSLLSACSCPYHHCSFLLGSYTFLINKECDSRWGKRLWELSGHTPFPVVIIQVSPHTTASTSLGARGECRLQGLCPDQPNWNLHFTKFPTMKLFFRSAK